MAARALGEEVGRPSVKVTGAANGPASSAAESPIEATTPTLRPPGVVITCEGAMALPGP